MTQREMPMPAEPEGCAEDEEDHGGSRPYSWRESKADQGQ
jgi:hypothetical protein